MGTKEYIPRISLAVGIVTFSGLMGCATHRADLDEVRAQLTTTNKKLADLQQENQSLQQQIKEIQFQLHERALAERDAASIGFPSAAPDVPAADSVEGKLRSEGKTWERRAGEPEIGGYVQDILEGRLGQPQGRGSIGKVLAIGPNNDGNPCASVDFGRGYVAGIMFRELSRIRFLPPEAR